MWRLFFILDNLLHSTSRNSSVVKQHDSGASFVLEKNISMHFKFNTRWQPVSVQLTLTLILGMGCRKIKAFSWKH